MQRAYVAIHAFLTAHQCLHKPFIICCSGGPDSTYLVHELAACTTQKHMVIYFNHHQRPNEITNEINHVQQLSNQYNYPFILIDLPKMDRFSHNVYRSYRIDALKTLCQSHPGYSVVTGHHLDDDIETLFYQLSKGATRHLHGIPPITKHSNCTIYHPMLTIPKSSILSYLSANNYSYCSDSSNQSQIYTRNNIRSILPTVYRTLNTSAIQLGRSLTYLKQKRHERNGNIPHKQLDGYVLIRKTDIPSLDACLTFIEQQTGSYINRTQEKQLTESLNQSRLTRLILSTCVIEIDYKWVCISKSDSCVSPNNDLFPYGNFSFQHSIPAQSTLDCLRVSQSVYEAVSYASIDDCSVFIPNKKKRLRCLTISPIQQKFWPVVYVDDCILWIPNVFISDSFGSYAMQFESHLYS